MSKMFLMLLKARALALGASFRIGKNKKKSVLATAGIAVLFLYVAVVAVGMFYFLFDALCEVYHMLGIDWLYFAMMAIMMLVLMLVVGIFKTQSEIFGAKDNEFLLSMPIKPSIILASRQAMLYLEQAIMGVVVAASAEVVYIRTAGFSGKQFAAWLILVLVLPFFSMTVSTLVAWGIHRFTSKMRNQSFVTVAATMIFLALYFLGYSKMQDFMMLLLTKGEIIAGVIRDRVLPFYWVGNGACGKFLHLLISAAICILPFWISYRVLSHFLYQLLTKKQAAAKIVYQKKSMKARSVTRSLFMKEWKYFLSQPVYILNGAMGSFMLVLMTIAAIWKKDDLRRLADMIPGETDYIPAIMLLAIGSMATMNMLTASSISLEGKSFPILKAFPIRAKEILHAKLSVHLAVTLPAVVFALVGFLAAFQIGVRNSIAVALGSVAFAIFGAVFGLWLNLLMPDFNWSSEIYVVKQSVPVFVAMMLPMALEMAMALLYVFWVKKVMGLSMYMWMVIGILVAVDVLLYWLLRTAGCRNFEKM